MRTGFLRILPLLLITTTALCGVAWLLTLKGNLWVFVIEERRQWLDWVLAHPVMARGLFMLGYTLYVLAGIPASLFLTMLGGFLFGFAEAVLLACVAATLGASGLIAGIRLFFRPWARRRLGARYEDMPDLLQPDFVLAATLMGALALLPPVWRRWRARQK